MPKKTGLITATRKITGIAGKGAYTFNEIRPPAKGGSHSQAGTGSVLSKGGTPIQSAIKKITGIEGKGAYRPSEIMPGSKRMSTKHPGLDTASPERMSSKHGLTGQTTMNNMNAGGGNRIGKDCRTFKHEAYPTAGPRNNSPNHSQAPAHKDKA